MEMGRRPEGILPVLLYMKKGCRTHLKYNRFHGIIKTNDYRVQNDSPRVLRGGLFRRIRAYSRTIRSKFQRYGRWGS